MNTPTVIFLSYRRGDTQWAARGIYERLADRYGRGNVFRDVDAIPAGARFRDHIESRLSESDVILLLIGKTWASYTDETGKRRLEQPRDPVRVEVETALRLGLPIIPVKVDGAPMPTERELVPSIVDILEFNAAEVTDSRWDYDVDRLLVAIDQTVAARLRRSALEAAARREAVIELSTAEVAPKIRTRSWGTARKLLGRRAVILATVVLGGAGVLVTYRLAAQAIEPAIISHLPGDVRSTCKATADKSATCHLADRTVVFFKLFDTAAEATADVTGQHAVAPAGEPCPPTAPSVNTSVVCRYTIGSENGLASFSHTAKGDLQSYESRWVPDAEPLLRGEMSTGDVGPLDWTTLTTNWSGLAGAP